MAYSHIKKLGSKFLAPTKVIEHLGIKPDDVIIDFGSGSGYWVIPIAKIVGPKGSVIAIDKLEENLRILKDKADRLGLRNIRYIKAPYTSKIIPVGEKADLIIISNILSIVKTGDLLISSIKKNAKDGAKLVIVDWNKETQMGPKKEERLDIEDVIIKTRKAGFEFKKLLPTGKHHFGLYFEFIK